MSELRTTLRNALRNAVIFTGALRTIRKSIRYFKENVLDAMNSVHIFICVQNDTYHRNEDWDLWFKEQMGEDRVQSIEWFSLEAHPDWVAHRERQLGHLLLDHGWKAYLRSSGSMIEYYQLQLAYMALCEAEQRSGMRYDYVIRARTDSIYAKPVDFHWLDWSVADVAARMERVSAEMQAAYIEGSPRNLLLYFMCTMLSDDTLPNLKNIWADYSPADTDRILMEDLTATTLQQYIRQGRYILTIRKNNLYVVQRRLFHLIPTLGTMYGFLRSPAADDYWFNAEGQFRDACYYSCVSVFDYNTALEDKSVLSADLWQETDFFTEDGKTMPQMLFCIVRR